MLRVGLISDTHGLLRPEAGVFLQGCDHIIHGGDIGGPGILEALTAIAPVTAVRGNNDTDAWARALRRVELVQVGDVLIYAIHNIADAGIEAIPSRARVVVSGHSHRPEVTEREGVVFINPGSAGPRRFSLPVALGELRVEGGRVSARTVEICRADPR